MFGTHKFSYSSRPIGFTWPLTNTLQMYKHYFAIQESFCNFFSGGLISDIYEECEHAGVEATTLLEETLNNPAGVITREQIEVAATRLRSIHHELLRNLFWLPVDRHLGRPGRKRFATTLDGEFSRDD